MLRRPDVDEVMEYGRALGFDLTPMEARMIQARMMDTIAALEAFDEMRVEERRPPLRFTDRDPGRRPSAAGGPARRLHHALPGAGRGERTAPRQDRRAQGPHRARRRAA